MWQEYKKLGSSLNLRQTSKAMRNSPKYRTATVSDAPVTDINTTPLIDVMLVLLIMLIITIPVQLHAVKLNLPQGAPPPSLSKPEVVRIDITASNQVLWNSEPVTDVTELVQRMQAVAAQTTPPEVHVRPDQHAPYATLAAVLANAQRQGLNKIGIVGSEQFVP